MAQVNVPTFDKFMNPVIEALKRLGGSGTIEEINNTATEIAKLPDEQLEVLHDPEKGSQTAGLFNSKKKRLNGRILSTGLTEFEKF